MGKTIEPNSVIRAFLDAVESRSTEAVVGCFAEDAEYQNVPHPPKRGRAAIQQLFAPILSVSEKILWDVISQSTSGNRVHLERLDRFWIRGTEYSVACHAVITIDTDLGLIISFRDYVDLSHWRSVLGDVLNN